MLILSIETSCDETAISLVEATGEFPHATYDIHGNAPFAEAALHLSFSDDADAFVRLREWREQVAAETPENVESLRRENLY